MKVVFHWEACWDPVSRRRGESRSVVPWSEETYVLIHGNAVCKSPCY